MMKLLGLGSRKAAVLLVCFIVIIVLAILGSAFLLRTVGEKNIVQKAKEHIQAFYLAQAGVMRALSELRQDYSWPGTTSGQDVDLVYGEYRVSVEEANTKRKVIASGFIPESASAFVQRTIEVFVQKEDMPLDFFDNALYSSGDATFNGNAYEVNGDVIYAGEFSGDSSNVDGDVIQDPSISPLARLDFCQLRQISASQGNVYDAFRLSSDFLPGSFWYTRADDGVDNDEDGTSDEADEWVPNIVYVEADLVLRGNVGIVGGVFVVVGDVITDPDNTQDTTINGNGEIDGCVYTTGEFTVNGGGNGINVNGGVWAGLEATLNGNVNVTYNAEYMDALDNLPLNTDIQIISWQELFP